MGLSKKNKQSVDDASFESHYIFRKKNMRAGFSSKEQAEGTVGTEIRIGRCHYCGVWAVIVPEIPNEVRGNEEGHEVSIC